MPHVVYSVDAHAYLDACLWEGPNLLANPRNWV